jgi:N-hydroxyarylamine O-acetyltransferase
VALQNNRLTIHIEGQEPERRVLESVAGLREVLSDSFGIALPAAEQLDPKLEEIIAQAVEQ